MTRRDPDDEVLDLEAVGADDALVERLRRSLSPDAAVVWGDDDADADGEDPSYALLRALQYDVSADLPAGPVLPAEVVPLRASRRSLGRTATVAAVTAGVLSLAGVAAAASSSPVRSAVADAVSTVVRAITPDPPATRVGTAGSASDTPTATISPPGQLVRRAARSAEAARFIGAALARADELTKAGQYAAAGNLLDAAERRLPLVTPADGHDALQALIAIRRAELATARAAAPTPPRKPTARPARKPTARPTARATARPHATDRPETGRPETDRGRSQPKRSQPERTPPPATPTATPAGHARSVPVHLPRTVNTHAADGATRDR